MRDIRTLRERAARLGRMRRLTVGVLVMILSGWGGACAGEVARERAARAAALRPPDPQVVLIAELDTTLGLAIAQGRLAALQASDPALRAWAAQSVARYAALRGHVRVAAERVGLEPDAPLALGDDVQARTEAVRALRARRGARFDRAYVEQALELHRALEQSFEAAVRVVHDRELREALRGAGLAARVRSSTASRVTGAA